MAIFAKLRNGSMKNIQEISKLPFFFIIGRPRSGTTLLRTILDAHPNLCIPHESPVILNLYSKYGKKTHWEQKDLESLYKNLESQHVFDVWNIDKTKLKNDILSCKGDNSFQNLVKILYLNFDSIYDKEDIRIIGDKNPTYSVNFPEVFPLFENAKFIHLTRDYRDQIVSMKEMDFELSHPALIAYRWKLSAKSIQKYKTKFPDRILSIKYENLVVKPETRLVEICNFLGVKFNTGMLEFYKQKASHDFLPEAAMNKYHSSLFNPISNSKVNSWASILLKREVRIADMIVGNSAELIGYKRKFVRTNYGLYISVFPILCYGKVWNLFRKIINVLPFRMKMMIKNKGHILPGIYKKMKTSK